ncbi:MAG: efflux RND transporter permease subunit, partial [Rikenellaceae bacterium]|nr:efflux RND transporter permease subunit [Rikenellaceae bacterium]
TITKQPSGVDIRKHNQSYELTVAFDFIGSYELAGKVMKRHVDRLNDEVLPIGFRARVQNYGWGGGGSDWRQFRLILLIAAIIYLICSIVFESLLKPLAIIMMIPVSFVGLFLAFGFSGWRFDHGGFAAFVLLSGLVVNAGIYVINEFGIVRRDRPGRSPLRAYVKGYSRKIVPVLLTVLSTVLGLIPFLVEGDGEVFWFSFAAGAMGGMLMSVVALVVILPVFVPVKRK